MDEQRRVEPRAWPTPAACTRCAAEHVEFTDRADDLTRQAAASDAIAAAYVFPRADELADAERRLALINLAIQDAAGIPAHAEAS